MNDNRFDALARRATLAISRRKTLRYSGGAVLASILGIVGSSRFRAAEGKSSQADEDRPNTGFDLHVEAKLHFPGDPEAIAHHYCKAVAGGMIECLLFDSDAPDARLVGIEVIVDAATYEAFDAEERQLWHYHKDEIPKVEATLPDLSPEEAADVVAQIEDTYGKLYILWDLTQSDLTIGEPSLTVLH